MKLFKTKEAEASAEDIAAAERLNAIAARFKAERATYSNFKQAAAEPGEDAATAATEWPAED